MSLPLQPFDILECRIICSVPSQVAVTVRHWRVGTPITGTLTLSDAISAISGELGPRYIQLMTNNASFRRVDGRRLFPNPSASEEGIDDPQPGVEEDNMLPTQVCGLLKVRTTQPGPAGRGRVYLPFPAAVFHDNSTLGPSAAYLSLGFILGQALFEDDVPAVGSTGSGVLEPLFYSPKTASLTVVDSFTISDRWATQRSRGAYGHQEPFIGA